MLHWLIIAISAPANPAKKMQFGAKIPGYSTLEDNGTIKVRVVFI